MREIAEQKYNSFNDVAEERFYLFSLEVFYVPSVTQRSVAVIS